MLRCPAVVLKTLKDISLAEIEALIDAKLSKL